MSSAEIMFRIVACALLALGFVMAAESVLPSDEEDGL